MRPDPISFEDGFTVTFKDPATIRNKERKKLLIGMEEVTGGDIAKGLSATDALIAMAVESWTIVLEGETAVAVLPSADPAILDELTIAQYDAISKGAEPFQKALFPDFDPNPDPTSPTEPSSV